MSTIADIHQRRLAFQRQVKNVEDEEEDDDYKKKTSRFAEFLFFPALLGTCFYLGQKAESVLLSVDQFLGDKHRFDLGFTLVEAEGELIGGEIARLESRHVELRHAQSGPALTRLLAAFERCESVAQLSFVNAVNIDADAVLAALTRAPHIRTVNVRGGDGGFALPLLRALSTNALPHVEKLALRNAEVRSWFALICFLVCFVPD